jgi:hypothetical protein
LTPKGTRSPSAFQADRQLPPSCPEATDLSGNPTRHQEQGSKATDRCEMGKLPMSQDGQSCRRENDGAEDQACCTGCRYSDQDCVDVAIALNRPALAKAAASSLMNIMCMA